MMKTMMKGHVVMLVDGDNGGEVTMVTVFKVVAVCW